MTTQQRHNLMYDALRSIVTTCPNVGAGESDAYRMCRMAEDALKAVEAEKSLKSVAELREISLAADRVANFWAHCMDTCPAADEREIMRKYIAAADLSHLEFRALVDHPDYCVDKENT